MAAAPACWRPIECRLYAENPARNFLPSPGTLHVFGLPPTEADVRIDTGFRQGDTITPFYDPMIAKVICRGDTRAQTIERMKATLGGITVEGLKSNVAFLQQVMRHPDFAAGAVSIDFVERHKAELIQE